MFCIQFLITCCIRILVTCCIRILVTCCIRILVFESSSYVLYSIPHHMLYSNPRHMLYSNPRHIFIRIFVTCYSRILLNASIHHVHKQSVMMGNRHNILAAYKCRITSPGMSASTVKSSRHLRIDHHTRLQRNCPGNDRDCS